jgi:hypothetical protein
VREILTMSELGQTEKNSMGAYVFRFALNFGSCESISAVARDVAPFLFKLEG